MNQSQNKFIQKILNAIPMVLRSVEKTYKSEVILGRRRIGGRVVVLKLVAEVDQNVSDPSAHGSGMHNK